MVWPESIRNIVVELFVGGRWVEVSSPDVLQRDDIQIRRGYSAESNSLVASTATLTLENNSGDYTPQNPMGQWYGTLGRNTPIRVSVGELDYDVFGRTVANGWGTSTSGTPWGFLNGAASTYAVGSNAGTHTIASASSYRLTYLNGPVWRDIEQVVTVGMSIGDVTGNSVEPANLMFRGVDITDQGYMLRVKVLADQSVTMEWQDQGLATVIGDTITVAGLTYGTGMKLRVRAHADNLGLRAKVWDASGGEPLRWQLIASVPFFPRMMFGWVGIRSGVSAGNTNGTVVFSYTEHEVMSPRMYGEVADWPPDRDVTGNDSYVQISGAGILRRLSQGQSALESTMRRKMTRGDNANPAIAYWPCEDGSKSTSLASGIGGPAMTMRYGPSTLATSDSFDCSAPLPELRNAEWFGLVPSYTDTGEIQCRFLLHMPAVDEAATGEALVVISTTGLVATWHLQYQAGGNLQLRAFSANNVELFASGSIGFGLQDNPVRASLEINALTATSVHWSISTITPGGVAGGFEADQSGVALGTVTDVVVNPVGGYLDVVLGHVGVQTEITDIFSDFAELSAYVGETAEERVDRLCGEENIPVTIYRGVDDSSTLGAQRRETLLRLLQDVADVDQGWLYEPRGDYGLEYRCRGSAYTPDQAETLTLDLAAGEVQPGFKPVTDDRITRNDWTVSRFDGSSARHTQDDGPMSILPADEGGVGVYDDTISIAAYRDEDLPDQASWRVALGTVNEPRGPSVPITLTEASIDQAAALSANVGDIVVVENASSSRLYDSMRQVIRGYREILNAFVHRFDYAATPASPYDVFQLDHVDSRLDTAGSEITTTINSSATALEVATTAGPPWITTARDAAQFPIPIKMGGEELSFTAISNHTMAFVGVGTAAHADNASVSPGLPSGWAAGNLLLLLGSVRTGTPVRPTGYRLMHLNDGMALYARIATVSESAPSFGISGGAAGSTVSAQMVAFSGTFYSTDGVLADTAGLEQVGQPTGGVGVLNPSAQDIVYPAREVWIDNCVVLYLGSKLDDWTSVASPGTEIGEPSSTLGNDQGIVWAYQIQTTATNVAAGSFVVTGGATAVSRGSVVVLRCDVQSVTAGRSVNAVVKGHAAGTPLALKRRATMPL